VFEQAKQVSMEFNCGRTLVAQTNDGAAVMAGEHEELQAKRRERLGPTGLLNWPSQYQLQTCRQSGHFLLSKD
jgi:hypothetical protein